MTEIVLIGDLGRKFGANWNLQVKNGAEAIRAIAYQSPGFAEYLNDSAALGIVYQVLIDDFELETVEQIDYPISQRMVIAPVVIGSGAVGRILSGAAVLLASAFMPATFLGISSLTWGGFGLAMVTGGITELLSPQQKEGNSFLSNPNAIRDTIQGTPVPVLFGERFIEPVPISIFVENENIPVDWNP